MFVQGDVHPAPAHVPGDDPPQPPGDTGGDEHHQGHPDFFGHERERHKEQRGERRVGERVIVEAHLVQPGPAGPISDGFGP